MVADWLAQGSEYRKIWKRSTPPHHRGRALIAVFSLVVALIVLVNWVV
jgi:hypothetical protein